MALWHPLGLKIHFYTYPLVVQSGNRKTRMNICATFRCLKQHRISHTFFLYEFGVHDTKGGVKRPWLYGPMDANCTNWKQSSCLDDPAQSSSIVSDTFYGVFVWRRIVKQVSRMAISIWWSPTYCCAMSCEVFGCCCCFKLCRIETALLLDVEGGKSQFNSDFRM